MARAVVDLYHGAGAGDAAEAEFDKVFKDHGAPTDMDEYRVAAGTQLSDALLAAGLVPSKREARRAIEQGSVRVDGEKCAADAPLTAPEHVVQVGKRRWARINTA
jgi:tyrosyl-tRNA synthetase